MVFCSSAVLSAVIGMIGVFAYSAMEYGTAFRELMITSEARGNPLGLLPQGYAAIVEDMVKRERISRAEATRRLTATLRAPR